MQKAQVALWVIVALIVIIAGVLVYLLFPDIFLIGFSREKAQKIIFEQSENLRDTISYCVSETVKYCLKEIGTRGGYYYVDDLDYVDFAGKKYIVVFYDSNSGKCINKFPSLDRIIGKSLNECMEAEGWKRVDDCVKLDSFKKFFDIKILKERSLKVDTEEECNLVVNIDWPMKLSKVTLAGKVEQQIQQKEGIIIMCVKRVWEVANDIVNIEVNANCSFVEGWVKYADNYIANNRDLVYIDLRSQNYPNYTRTIFMLKSKPHLPKEEEFPLYFVILRK